MARTTATQYWKMIGSRAWAEAWSTARSWSALAAIGIGIAGLYFTVPNDLRIQLAWEIPSAMVILLLAVFTPAAIYESYKELEAQVASSEDDLVNKWFHTMSEEGKIQYQGKVLENRNGRYLIQLYSFLDGEPTTQRFMTAQEYWNARFYHSNKAMLAEYERLHPPRVR